VPESGPSDWPSPAASLPVGWPVRSALAGAAPRQASVTEEENRAGGGCGRRLARVRAEVAAGVRIRGGWPTVVQAKAGNGGGAGNVAWGMLSITPDIGRESVDTSCRLASSTRASQAWAG